MRRGGSIALAAAIAVAAAGGCKERGRAAGVSILPGAPPVPAALATRLAALGGGERHTNRLALERSPYLRQHAHNPVDWRPWGEEALAEARRLRRPILLSIGYSTCHWCHVMAEESFEDLEIATYLNAHYVAIKVDREERPDLDAVYQRALEAMGEPGGWPLTVWLTPDGAPFFGGTYFPARDGDRGVGIGFLTVLRRGRALWDEQRGDLVSAAAEVTQRMKELAGAGADPEAAGAVPGAAVIERAVTRAAELFDEENGGLAARGERAKFPGAMPIRLLLRHARRTGDAGSRRMAERTLEQMARGGIHDHVGGGFHRYATDPRWLVPHFEKMLYDSALLAVRYLDGYQATGRDELAEVARGALDFMVRDLGAPDGGFFAALDASSAGPGGEREEGRYYTWTPAELAAAVGPEAAPLARAWFGVSEAGNFGGRSVLATMRPLDEVAAAVGVEPGRAAALVDRARRAMRAARERRPRPHRDEKIVAAWNALAISALVRGALVLDRGAEDSAYRARALAAAEHLFGRMSRADGSLARVWIDGEQGPPGVLEDHALALAAALDLFELTGDARWLERARALDRVLARDFEDPAGGFFLTARGGPALLIREKPVREEALPSGNAVMAMNLRRLGALTGEAGYGERLDRLLAATAGELDRAGLTAPALLHALEARLHPGPEIVLVAPESRTQLAPFLAVLAGRFAPDHLLVPVVEGEVEALAPQVPLLAGKRAIGGAATAFVCRAHVCRLPSRDPAAFEAELERALAPAR